MGHGAHINMYTQVYITTVAWIAEDCDVCGMSGHLSCDQTSAEVFVAAIAASFQDGLLYPAAGV